MKVEDIREGDVVRYVIWRQVVSVVEEHAPEYNMSWKTLYFEDGTHEIFNIYENLQVA
jgi:hypothetical protein